MNLDNIKRAAVSQSNNLHLPPQPRQEPPASDTVHAISDAQASVAMNVPDWALKGWDYAAGKGTDFINNTFGTNFDNPHAKTWDEARDEDDYVIQWANEEAQKHDLSTPEGRENMRYEGSKLGHPGWTRSLMDYGRQNPDSWQARTANVLVPVENFWRRFIMKDAPVNAAFAATPLGPLKYLGPTGRTALAVGTEAAIGASDGMLAAAGEKFDPRISLMAGVHHGQNEETQMRRTYGDAFTNAQAQNQYMGQYIDEQGNPQSFSGSEIKDPARLGEALGYFNDYQKYRSDFGIADNQMSDEANLMGYVMNRLSAGTPGTELFHTPMFRMLSPDHKVEAMNTWLDSRYRRAVDNNVMPAHMNEGRAAMLSAAIANDRSGIFNSGFNAFLQSSDVPTILMFFENNAGGGGAGGNTEALMSTMQNGLVQSMKADPSKVRPMLQGVLKLQAAQSLQDSKDPTAPNRGAQMIRNSFKEVLADPEVFQTMAPEDKLKIIQSLAKVYSSGNGQALLGDQGDALSQAVVENLQKEGRLLLLEHPEYAPELTGAWLDTKNMSGAAEVARNPWIFWAGAGTLLFGGILALNSVLDDDEEDEDEEDEDYRRALRRIPFT